MVEVQVIRAWRICLHNLPVLPCICKYFDVLFDTIVFTLSLFLSLGCDRVVRNLFKYLKDGKTIRPVSLEAPTMICSRQLLVISIVLFHAGFHHTFSIIEYLLLLMMVSNLSHSYSSLILRNYKHGIYAAISNKISPVCYVILSEEKEFDLFGNSLSLSRFLPVSTLPSGQQDCGACVSTSTRGI